MLSKKAIENFKQIYKAQYEVDLDDSEAEKKARKLVTLFIAVLGGYDVNNK